MKMPVVIFHNVARVCRACDQPITRGADGTFRCIDGQITDEPAYCTENPPSHQHIEGLANYDGYQEGHPLVRVYATDFEVPNADADPKKVAGWMFWAFNADVGTLPDLLRSDGEAYRARKLRSLSVGDVVLVGEVPLACAGVGFVPVTGRVNILTEWHEATLTVLLPA